MTTRFHLFTLIHKGLRHALQQLVWTAGKLDYTDVQEREAFFEEFRRISAMLHQHASDEDSFIQPLIDQCAPDVGQELETQHQRSDGLLDALIQAVEKMASATSVSAQTWQAFLEDLNQFVGDYFLHLYHEESVAMPLLWEAFDDAELMAAGIKVRNNVPQHIQSDFQRYMIPALNVHEQATMLANMKHSVPEPLFRQTCELFESLLRPQEYANVIARLQAAAASK
ncbi:hemerythrin domain-containing protein [Paenibacillus chartarius]|uniref:Hemerythrin domain-containing protein n=1 Tax=Paenibacillus chartarius TaxID=747481 RepID=A0ABV6DJJ0_9BACL